MSRKHVGLWLGVTGLWGLGLGIIGRAVMPSASEVAQAIAPPAPETPPPYHDQHRACWSPLAHIAMPPKKVPLADGRQPRGTVVSDGVMFTLLQDSTGHFYRQPIPGLHRSNNDKRTQSVTDSGTDHDTTPQPDRVDHSMDIQRCSG